MASCAPGSATRAGGKWWLHNIAAPYQQPNFPQQCVCCTAEHWSTFHRLLTSFAPLVVRETAGVVTSFTYGCTTGTAPQLVQLHMQRSARHARGGGRVRSVLGTESLSYYTVTLRAPIILCNTVTPRAPILHRARESPCDRPQTRGQGVLLRPSTF